MYKKVDGGFDAIAREKEIIQFWQENDIFKKSIAQRDGSNVFTFYDGPPTANGKPHIGHVLTRVMKDIIPRYKTMQGYHVLRKAGWDTHGLPVELEIEKLLGISGKPQIEGYGVEPFINKCKESVWKYKGEWEEMSERVGYWADMENPYVTYNNNYIESVWWALKQIWDKDLLYKGHKIMPYCPRCGTSLSSHEVAQGYKDVKEDSVIAKFKVKGTENEYILAWTTTPWTLPSNVALCVNPKEQYVKVKCDNEYYILAKELCEKNLPEGYEIVEEKTGEQFVGLEYVPLFDFATVDKKAYYIVCDDYVTLTDGTGIVHIAPAFGEDDANVGKKYDLPFVQLVGEDGKFKKEVVNWAGVFCKDADKDIIKYLRENGLLFKKLPYEHSYPFCWRCDTPLLYYACDTWFIKMTAVRDRLVANNQTVNWLPDNIKDGRFGKFLENVIDWGLSRSRYWGTPLPIWECECGHKHVIGSIEELKQKGINVPNDIELHKPYIDAIKLKCDKCGGEMKRVSEVIDCWFDAGSMPFAQWHYPFENKEIFESHFPADYISEAIDQTRGWFYTLMAISTLLFDKAPYKNVIVLGHVQDKDGMKMSKHKGNVVNPWDVLNKQGADAIRWYFYTNSAPWVPNRFHDAAVDESQRKFMGTLMNTYSFFVMYAQLDNFDPSKYTLEYDKLATIDKWILSKLHTLFAVVCDNLDNYKITEAARAMQDFVDELSNWYIRRNRERFWQSQLNQDKINAYMTLYTVLVELSKLSAPFIPFTAEDIYSNLYKNFFKDAPISVHLCDYPVSDSKFIDKALEDSMEKVLKIVNQGRACRNTANIKNRQPVSKIYVICDYQLDDMYKDLILDELNVKDIEMTSGENEFVSYKLKPQLRTLGPKYGKLLGKISAWLASCDASTVVSELKNGNTVSFNVDDSQIELSLADVLIESTQIDGYISDGDSESTVVMDTNLTPELIEQGIVREIISKIQTMRKSADFEILDHIVVGTQCSDKLMQIISKNAAEIKAQTLCDLIEKNLSDYSKQWDINGENVTLSVKKV